MKRMIGRITWLVIAGQLLPSVLFAQEFSGEISGFQTVLEGLYDEMIPLCSRLIGVGRGLAGFGAMWYIASRVWRHIANAEAVDFYPLLRPFALGMVVMMFPSVLALMNSVLQPTVTGTAAMVDGSNNAIAELLRRKEEAIQKTPYWQMYVGFDGSGDKEKWYRYTHPEGTEEGFFDGIGNDIKFAMAKASFSFRNSIKQWMSEVLQILFEAAGLCINTIRTFYLIVLAILGPLVLGLSVFDGFQHTLRIWLARYINVFLWLPVANIFGSIIGKIQENMLKIDIQQVQKYGDTFFSSADTAYLIFMVIGIVGYFTVPGISNYIVNAGGGNVLLFKATNLFTGGAQSVSNTALHSGRSMMSSIDLSRYQGSNEGGSRATSQPAGPEIKKDSEGGYMHRKVSGQ